MTATSPSTNVLLRPFTSRTLTSTNRFVMAPMTRTFSPNGIPTAASADYYARRAAGGVGLIITEGTVIGHDASAASTDVPRFFGEEPLAGWKPVLDRVHAGGAKMIPQLWHVGLDRDPKYSPYPHARNIGPSGRYGSFNSPECTMTTAEIDSVIQAFALAAANAQSLGFDGVEIHGGHGYLIDQFLWSETNARTDRYGGSIENRTRFATEIVQEIRRQVGPTFPIVFRFSQWKTVDFAARPFPTPAALEATLSPLAAAGVDIFHASTRRFWLSEFEGSDLNLAGWTKKITGLPTITVGSIGLEDSEFLSALLEGKGAAPAALDQLERMCARGDFDLVAVGRALISDPEMVNRVREGRLESRIPFDAAHLMSLV